MNRNTRLTKTFIGTMVLAALGSTIYAALATHATHTYYALAVLALAAATSRMKVKLPGIEGSMSVNLPFLLMAVVTLSAVEAVLIAAVATVVQCLPQSGNKFRPEQMLFNVSMMAFAASMANLVWNAAWLNQAGWSSHSVMLASATAVFFLGQTVPVAGIIHLSQGSALLKVWKNIVQLSFPYYVVSAGVTSMLNLVSYRFGWQAAMVVFPLMYGIYSSYKLYFKNVGESLPTQSLARAASVGA
jgi:hypothetical protein